MPHGATRNPRKSEATPYEVIRVDSWNEFESKITSQRYVSWAFRGQTDASWPLLSKLSRHLRSFHLHPKAWRRQEERILRIFKRKAHHFLTHLPAPDDEFQWLALMQHHGAPTRLLDLTWSPYVAAFFALETATGDAAVWALNSPVLGRTPFNVWDKKEFRMHCLEKQSPSVMIAEPHDMNRRLIAQSGTFAIPGTVDTSIDEIVGGYEKPKELLTKFVLPSPRIRDEAMFQMFRMNITNATLFPDLDGLARSLAYELEYHWEYDPKTMKHRPGF